MLFEHVFLWTDALVYVLIVVIIAAAAFVRTQEHLRQSWHRVGRSAAGMAGFVVLSAFVLVGLLDSVHFRVQLERKNGQTAAAFAVEVTSVLDLVLKPLKERNEKTYSAPLAYRLFARETIELPEGRQAREFPRLRYGGAHLKAPEQELRADVIRRTLAGAAFGFVLWLAAGTLVCAGIAHHSGGTDRGANNSALTPQPLSQRERGASCCPPERADSKEGIHRAWERVMRGETEMSWRAILIAAGGLFILIGVIAALATKYHVFGTSKVGQDVLYQSLKSVRTALVIGTLTTLVMLPFAVLLGIAAGYFKGWVDDLIQYVYTTLNSIPSVLLIAAAVLMMQVYIDTHPELFPTSAERADLRLLFLCAILGVTSWTGLCRLLRGETLKIRELDYIQAAQAFGVTHLRIILRHILPNVMHIVLIAVVMEFSSLVLAEAVLSYVGVGVDPSMISFGTMINAARLEMAREPMVWWSLACAFGFMFALVLSANLFADAVRDAFDPRVLVANTFRLRLRWPKAAGAAA